ncbi:MAG TPA: M28 family peptidase [Thermoanaerobaculia bacterium]|nr:M28 family peptidase [Thermoanaerobaculia bacterium]
MNGDAIYNGAVDDAVGVGQLLAVAEALATTRPPRTMLFLATSAEEHPLLGARHYVAHPVLPLSKTLLNIVYDIIDTSGATRDVRLFGSGRSTLDEHVEGAARLQGRVVTRDSESTRRI